MDKSIKIVILPNHFTLPLLISPKVILSYSEPSLLFEVNILSFSVICWVHRCLPPDLKFTYKTRLISSRLPNLLGSLDVSYQGLWHSN
jgi:hypothetical protein